MRYMLDTNTVSYILKGRSLHARRKMGSLGPDEDVCISSVTEAEVRYGLAKRPAKAGFGEQIERFLEAIDVIPWGSDAARAYGSARRLLENAGKPLSNMDLMIAAHAMAENCVLVTNDRAFRNLGNLLRTVNWADDLPKR